MPYGYNDWLALTQEPTLEPDLPICDPHHHFWDLRPGSVPYQRYLLHELNADIYSGHNIRSTVFLEARSMYRAGGPEELRPVGEVEFVQGLAAASASGVYGESRAAAAIMGHADLKLGAGVTPVLEALQAASPNRFRGIRHNITWNTDPTWDNRENEGIVNDAKFIEGAKVLNQMGLSLDIMQSFSQLPEIAEFAKTVPDLPIIVNHVGGVQPGRDIRRQGRRDNPRLEGRNNRRCSLPQRHHETWRAGHAPLRLRLACPRSTDRLGRIGRVDDALDETLHRAVWPRPVHVRKQLSSGQGFVLLQRDVQRVQAAIQRVFRSRTRSPVQ